VGGVLSQLPIIWSEALTLLDADTATNPNWTILMGSLAAVWAFFNARDNNVSSESAGAR